jgi:uncharacterized membrane protein YoaK (UPF0700 family)
MRNKEKISIGSIIVTIISHFFCCIVPLLLMLLNFIFGTSIVFKFELFNHNIADYILYISGIFIIISFIAQFKDKDTTKNERKILYISTILYFIMFVLDLLIQH